MKKLTLIVVLVFSVLSVSSCRRAPLVDVESAPLGAPRSATLDQITAAIERAGFIQGWQMTAQEPGQFLAKLFVRGKHTAIVTITYDKQEFSIIYESSMNLNYKVERNITYIHPNYLIWVDRLKSAIQQQAAAGASGQPDNAALRPSAQPSARPVIAALPPVKSRQEVEAYLSQNKNRFQGKLSSYNVQQRVMVDDYGLTEVTRVYSWEIKQLDGDLVLLEVNYEVGQPGYSTSGCRVLELKWVGEDLEFVRPRGACT